MIILLELRKYLLDDPLSVEIPKLPPSSFVFYFLFFIFLMIFGFLKKLPPGKIIGTSNATV